MKRLLLPFSGILFVLYIVYFSTSSFDTRRVYEQSSANVWRASWEDKETISTEYYVPFLMCGDCVILQEMLRKKQNPQCDDTTVVWEEQHHWGGLCGIGCDGHVVYHYFLSSVFHNRPFVTSATHPYSADDKCGSNTGLGKLNSHGVGVTINGFLPECYTEPMTTCDRLEIVKRPNTYHYNSIHIADQTQYGNNIDSIPKRFRHHGVMWWRSQLMYYLFRPNAKMRSLLSKEEEIIGLEYPCVAMHVRHGDRHKDKYVDPNGFKEFSLSQYIAALGKGVDITKFKSVLIMTEDNEVVVQADKENESLGEGMPRYVYVKNIRENLGVPEAIKAHGAYSEGLFGYKNLWLSSRCDMYVGPLSSQYTRLAVELMFARGVDESKVISLDWSFDYVINTYLTDNPY